MNKEKLPFETITIGTQTWSATNISLAPNSFNKLGTDYWNAYGNPNDTSDTLNEDGYYYTWDAAMNVCPSGWHLPTEVDWKVLEAHLGINTTEQNKYGWRGTDEGTKLKLGGSSGFDAKLAGMRGANGGFFYRGDDAYFWSSTESGNDACIRYLSTSNARVYRNTLSKALGFSVRLIKDE